MNTINKEICPVERAGVLDNKIRKLFQNPNKILGSYIGKDMTVLDFGCGPGFFSIEMAKMLNDVGKVIAVDLQDGMLTKLKNKISGSFLEPKILLHKCSNDKIGLLKPVDFVLAFYVIHEVPDQKKLFEELYSILKYDGKIFIAEPLFHVPKKSFEDMLEVSQKIGFQVVQKPNLFFSRAVLLKK